jgi:hypothetical protein
MQSFKNVFSLANIAKALTDTKSYASRSWTVNTNYMMCYRTLDAAIAFAGVDVDSNFSADYTTKEVQQMVEKYFSQITGDNVESYGKIARKKIWQHFLNTGRVLRAVIRDVNGSLIIYLYNYHQAVFAVKNGKKVEV